MRFFIKTCYTLANSCHYWYSDNTSNYESTDKETKIHPYRKDLHMTARQPCFIQRYFNHDMKNGMIGAGFILLSNLPAGFSFEVHPWYSCSIILSLNPATPGHFQKESSISAMLCPGDVMQSFPEQPNAALFDLLYSSAEKADILLFHVCFGAYAYESLRSAGLLLPDTLFHIPLESYMDGWMPALIDELKNTPQENLAEVYLNLQKFIIHLHRPLLNQTSINSRMVASAKQLLYNTCFDHIPLPKIAASLGYGYENFRKIFKTETGISPLQYTLDVKFHYAQRLLTEGMSVKETAAAVGYSDPYIFSKQFKKYIGQPPAAYKPKTNGC